MPFFITFSNTSALYGSRYILNKIIGYPYLYYTHVPYPRVPTRTAAPPCNGRYLIKNVERDREMGSNKNNTIYRIWNLEIVKFATNNCLEVTR